VSLGGITFVSAWVYMLLDFAPRLTFKTKTQKTEIVICGDINVNYLVDNNRKKCLGSLLPSYNLSSTVNFLTRIQNNSISAIDNIFVDNTKLETYTLTPLSNGLSDYEAQFLEICCIDLEPQNQQHQLIKKIDSHSMADFVMKLSYETWGPVFSDVGIDTKFNSFLSTYLRIFYSSFPLKMLETQPQITSG
jgi:hypothetical protein